MEKHGVEAKSEACAEEQGREEEGEREGKKECVAGLQRAGTQPAGLPEACLKRDELVRKGLGHGDLPEEAAANIWREKGAEQPLRQAPDERGRLCRAESWGGLFREHVVVFEELGRGFNMEAAAGLQDESGPDRVEPKNGFVFHNRTIFIPFL
jgi:hypothetical protein